MTSQNIKDIAYRLRQVGGPHFSLGENAATLIESQQRDLDTFKRILLAPGVLAHLRDNRTRQEFEDAMRLLGDGAKV